MDVRERRRDCLGFLGIPREYYAGYIVGTEANCCNQGKAGGRNRNAFGTLSADTLQGEYYKNTRDLPSKFDDSGCSCCTSGETVG
jgi:hypothetical protein